MLDFSLFRLENQKNVKLFVCISRSKFVSQASSLQLLRERSDNHPNVALELWVLYSKFHIWRINFAETKVEID